MGQKRLVQAYDAIHSGKVEILSLDVFDTLVWRKVERPADVFLLLGRRLKDEGWLIPAVTAELFAELRCEGERAARNVKRLSQMCSEVTLPEIYWQLKSLFVKLTTEEMLEGKLPGIYEWDFSRPITLELELEKKLIGFDPDILALAQFAIEGSCQVILVSDTYFEESHIHHLIEDKFYNIFLSSEYGVAKHEGLFEKVIQTLRIEPHKILHIGDNYFSDIAGASAVGIRTLYYPKYGQELSEILSREWPEQLSKRKCFLDAEEGDFGLSALRGKIGHQCPYAQEEGFYWRYGATVLGPVLFGYIHWIYSRCKEMGINEVFCLMREGRLYAKLMARFAPYFPEHQLEAKEIWVSRLFIAHAAMSEVSTHELKRLMTAFIEHYTVEQFTTYLGLNISGFENWSSCRHMLLEETDFRQQFIQFLISDAEVRQQIRRTAALKRRRFMHYLASKIDLSARQLTLVDVGWNGTTQKNLQTILHMESLTTQLHGLYLGTTELAGKALLKGVCCESFLCKGDLPQTKILCYVLEQTATAEMGIGPLQDIDADGTIINYPFTISEKQRNEASLVQKGIFAFFDYAGRHIDLKSLHLNAHSDALQRQLSSLFLRSMAKPTEQEAHQFGPWSHEHGPASSYLTQVIGKDSYYDCFIKDMLPHAAFKEFGLNWPSAYAAKQCKYLALTSEALWLKTIPPECFLSIDTYLCKIFLDTEGSFPNKAHKTIDLRSNANRNFYVRADLFSTKKSLKRLQLRLHFPTALVRIKSLRMSAYDKSAPKPQQLIFFESKEGANQILSPSADQLDFNTFYTQGPLTLEHRFDKAEIYHVKLKLCCEMFAVFN